ncbi:MAG: nucleotidyltransferase [Paenibacillus sp.]|jgi:predicted nucleotidyltransferase|nr:nucleotidyltransferase [Paenibacillus sp.]
MRRLNLTDIHTLSNNEKQAITLLKERIEHHFKFVKLIMFGSKARGDHNEFSDVDLMVLVEDPKTAEILEKLSELQFEVIMELDTPIMSTLENYRNWLEEKDISLPLKDNIESEGIEIEI